MAKAPDHFKMPCPICQTKIKLPIIQMDTSPAQSLPGYVNLHMGISRLPMRRHMQEAHGIVPTGGTTPKENSEHTQHDDRREPDGGPGTAVHP